MKQQFGNNHLPLFPLNSVVFIDSTLELQIFEQRYLQMIKNCMQNQHGFIIALIRKGKEVNDAAETFETGTYVEIIDWNTLNNNLLGITIQGRQRVIINKTHIHDDNLISAEFTYLNNLEEQEFDTVDKDLLSLLHNLQKHPFVANKYPDINEHSLINVAYKLCELLPTSNTEKQQLLEAEQTHHLIEQLKSIIAKLENLLANS